jgi:phosphosulfolactate synthase (CoM biosynthesis protein A)
MLMDQGWPTVFVDGMLESFGAYVDIVKLWDPLLMAPPAAVERRIRVYRDNDVTVQPGGIWLELARKGGEGPALLECRAHLGQGQPDRLRRADER